ncbi:MAG: restriction endonuclease subunit S [Acidimicrobiales bacterium]
MRELPKGWVEATLGNLGHYWNGRAFKKSEWRTEGEGRQIVRIQDLTGSHQVPNYFEGEAESRNVARSGDILVSWAATLGVFEWQGPEAVINQHIFKVESFIDRRFHRYLLESVLDDLRRRSHGSGVVHVTREVFDDTPVQLPPLTEQERIVAAIDEQLSRLDEAERLLRSGQLRVLRMRSSVLAAVTPMGGRWTSLGEIAEIVGGVTKDSKRQSDPSLVEVPYLRVANVQRGYLDLSEITNIRVRPEKAKALRLEAGDILFNEGGDRDKLGRGWVWQGEVHDCIHQNHVFRARLLTDDFDPKYVSYHGNTFGQRWFEKMGKQTTNLASINLRVLKSFPVPDLPVGEQRQIVAEVEQNLTLLDSLMRAIDLALARSRQLRRSILGRAFTGRLVPQDPSDEPASALLARIAAEPATATKPRRRQRA